MKNNSRKRLPEWLKRGVLDCDKTRYVRKLLADKQLSTVCESARCPNKGECYSRNTATFMILGNQCTRKCNFCAVTYAEHPQFFENEAENIANVIQDLSLEYVVITSVTRDDLSDGGARYFADVVEKIKSINNDISVEVLIPDFQGMQSCVRQVVDSGINVFNHNTETVQHLYSKARPQAVYFRSLELIKYAKQYNPKVITKSGFMLGLGETIDDIYKLLKDLKLYQCDCVTIGQYIQPTKLCLPVDKYYTPDEFDQIKQMAIDLGIPRTISGPLVRSSYKAFDLFKSI